MPKNETEGEKEKEGEKKVKSRPDWIRRGPVFPLHVNALPHQIGSDGLPVGFHYVLCTSDLQKKKKNGIPPFLLPPQLNMLFPLKERYKIGPESEKKKWLEGTFFNVFF